MNKKKKKQRQTSLKISQNRKNNSGPAVQSQSSDSSDKEPFFHGLLADRRHQACLQNSQTKKTARNLRFTSGFSHQRSLSTFSSSQMASVRMRIQKQLLVGSTQTQNGMLLVSSLGAGTGKNAATVSATCVAKSGQTM